MLRTLGVLIVSSAILLSHAPSHAQPLAETYVARLSERDHFNSNGQRLTSAAAIIRQDRANFHRFGLRDADDESDSYFADVENREALERLLERGNATPGTLSRIINSTPLIRVDIYRNTGGDFVRVTILE